MLSSRDVLAVLTQLREGIEGLAGAAHLMPDPKMHDAIESLQQQLDSVLHTVEDAARQSGIIPAKTILPRPTLPGNLSVAPETA